jgi:hypothetical protein
MQTNSLMVTFLVTDDSIIFGRKMNSKTGDEAVPQI